MSNGSFEDDNAQQRRSRRPHARPMQRRNNGPAFSPRTFWSLLAALSLPLWYLAISWLVSPPFGGFGEGQTEFRNDVVRNWTAADGGFLGLSTTLWIWIGISCLLGAIAILFVDNDGYSGLESLTVVACVIVMLTSVVSVIRAGTWTERDRAIKNASATTIYSKNLNKPADQITEIFAQTHEGAKPVALENGKIRRGELAVVAQGTMPEIKWEPRQSSLAAAYKWLNTSDASIQGVDVWKPSLTFVYGKDTKSDAGKARGDKKWIPSDADTSRVSVILNGSGRSRPIYGVAEWRAGQQKPTVCRFDNATDKNAKGDYKLTRAFVDNDRPEDDEGYKSVEGINNLNNVIGRWLIDNGSGARFFEDEDVSGYCDTNGKPVITISILRNVGAGMVTTPVPDCFMVIKGSPTGMPDITCLTTVKPGDFPVNVYPGSVAATQRDSIDFAAGVSNKENKNFGFQPSTYSTQRDNPGNYVLRNTADGTIWIVTPSKSNKTANQSYTLWQMVRGDSMQSGLLNPMDAYAIPEGEAVNIETLYSNAYGYMQWAIRYKDATQFVGPNFFSDGGKMEEFIPVEGTTRFRAHGIDRTGAPRFFIDISWNNIQPPLISVLRQNDAGVADTYEVPKEVLQQGNGAVIKPSLTLNCNGTPPADLKAEDAAACMNAYTEFLRKLAPAGK